MNGNVFQLHSERKNKSQFINTIEALRVYSSSEYKSEIESLNVLFTNLETPSVKKPKEPEETVTFDRDGASISTISRFEEMTYSERIKQWIRDDRSLEMTVRSLYNIVWGQCSKLMKNKLTMAKNFGNFEDKGDVTELLKDIRRISLQIETNTSIYDALDEAKTIFYTYRQEDNESNAKHLKNFKSIVEAIDHLGGSMFMDKALLDYERDQDDRNPTTLSRSEEELSMAVRERMMGVVFIKRASKAKYGKLMNKIRDQHAFNIDVYPKTLHDAYELLENHSSSYYRKQKEGNRTGRGGSGGHGGGRGNQDGRGRGRGSNYTGAFQYAQTEDIVPGSDGRTIARITCFKCNKQGHFADFCPEVIESEQMYANSVEIGEKNSTYEETYSDSDDSLVVSLQYAQVNPTTVKKIQ